MIPRPHHHRVPIDHTGQHLVQGAFLRNIPGDCLRLAGGQAPGHQTQSRPNPPSRFANATHGCSPRSETSQFDSLRSLKSPPGSRSRHRPTHWNLQGILGQCPASVEKVPRTTLQKIPNFPAVFAAHRHGRAERQCHRLAPFFAKTEATVVAHRSLQVRSGIWPAHPPAQALVSSLGPRATTPPLFNRNPRQGPRSHAAPITSTSRPGPALAPTMAGPRLNELPAPLDANQTTQVYSHSGRLPVWSILRQVLLSSHFHFPPSLPVPRASSLHDRARIRRAAVSRRLARHPH